MGGNIRGSIDQILNLVMFCKKVNIPFDVYAFTNCGSRDGVKVNSNLHKDRLHTGDWTGRFGNFNLLNLVTSKAKNADFQKHLTGMMMLRGGMGYGYGRNYSIPGWLQLGGTPLAEALMSAIPVVNKFRADNALQVVNTVFLTDGEGNNLNQVHDPTESDGSRYVGHGSRVIMRDRISRKEWTMTNYHSTAILLNVFRARTGSKIANFFIVEDNARIFKRYWTSSAPDNDKWDPTKANEAWKTARTEGGVAIEGSEEGWDAYYLIPGGTSLSIDSDEGLSDDLIGAKKGQLKKAFSKSTSGKLRNRVILRKFTEMIAA
jgi:hypothetical protein